MINPKLNGRLRVWDLLHSAALGEDNAFQSLAIEWVPWLSYYLRRQCRLAEAPHPDCLAMTLAFQVIQRAVDEIHREPTPPDGDPDSWWQSLADSEWNSWRKRNHLVMPLSLPDEEDLRPLSDSLTSREGLKPSHSPSNPFERSL
jgi:hypothetical protein